MKKHKLLTLLVGVTLATTGLTSTASANVVTWKNDAGVQLKDNWLYKYGNNYYFKSNGARATDETLKISGETYHFNKDGVMLKDGFVSKDGKMYYFKTNGEEAKDYFYKNWGNTYYFSKDGSRYTNEWYHNWGNTYYFGDGGVLYTNTTAKIDGKIYYFDENGVLAKNQYVTFDGVTYKADSNGVLTEQQQAGFDESQINYTYALASWQGSPYQTYNYYIIMHDVGAESGGAANANYLRNNWTNAYTQFVVGDGGEVYEVGEPGYVSWGALNANPYSPVQIELGRTWDRNTFIKDYTTYINVARHYADKYGIPKTLDYGGAGTPGIKTHNWVTENLGGSHVDPYGYLQSWGIDYDQFAHDLQYGINQSELNKTVYSYRQ